MKVLIVNSSDIRGGAARAAYRLHRALLRNDIDSQMLVQNKESDDFTVIGPTTKVQRAINLLRPTLDLLPLKFYKKKVRTLFSPSWLPFSRIVEQINEINPDIVHLHWICGGMMTIEDIARIKAPIVWTLHDNWAFTGGCHIMWRCEKYKELCHSCPSLGSSKKNDLSYHIWKRKEKVFQQQEAMTIVCLSQWLYNCSTQSSLLRNKKHVLLPNPIDTRVFKPFDKLKSRELWNLPHNKKLVLFGANNALQDVNKGFIKLSEALHQLTCKDVELVVFGSSEPRESQKFGFKTYYIGHIYDEVSLVTLYNAVDVMIVPSLQENLSNAIMEALACGTPIVAFDIGGNSDMIEHQKNGYLAKAFDTSDLARGIKWILERQGDIDLRQNAREKILQNFESNLVASAYIQLYKNTIEK